MKKNKTLNKLIILLTLLTPTIINAKELIVCGENKKFPTVIGTLISTVYTIIRILVPILLVISGIISFFKVTFNGNVEDSLDKAKKKLVTNIISAIVIFFIASIINFVIGLAAGKNNSFTDCMYCMLHPEECEQTDSEVATLCPGLISEQYKYNSDCTLKDEYKNGEKIDYSNTGDTKVPAYSNTIASAGGGAIARTLRDNPNATGSEYFKKNTYSGYSYYLYTPKQIDSDKAALIVYLHGRGGSGTTEAPLREDGGGGFFHEIEQNKKEYNAYILVLQVPSPSHFPPKTAMEIIEKIITENNINEKRVSIWGYSMGAEAMPAIVNTYPNFFASAVFIAKGATATVTGFKTVPTYIFYRTGDTTGTEVASPQILRALKNIGLEKAYMKIYPRPTNGEFPHANMPKIVLEDTNLDDNYSTIMDWVLDQRRTD